MTQAYVYVRFSTLAQEGGESYSRQKEGGLKLIADKGWTLAGTIEDLGRSAYKGEHMLSDGALGQFSDRVRRGDIEPGSWLIAEKTDRLSRQGWEVLFDWLREMTRKGLNVITLDGHVFTAETLRDQISVIKILLGGEADQQFSAKISERVQDAVRKNIAKAQTGEKKVLRTAPMSEDATQDHADCYREKYVAFIDMLGFGRRVKASAHDAEARKSIIEAIEHLRSTACPNPHVGLLITYFSDCIVISADETQQGLIELFRSIIFIADNLIQRDVLIRGGVTHGGIYHDNDLCFGPAMVRAYEIESKEAGDPCILLDPYVADNAESFINPGCVMADSEAPDRRYLNYLLHYSEYDAVPRSGGLVQTEPAKLIRHYITRRLLSDDPRVRAKGEWMRRYWDEIVATKGVLPAIDIEADGAKPVAKPSTIKLYRIASE